MSSVSAGAGLKSGSSTMARSAGGEVGGDGAVETASEDSEAIDGLELLAR